MKIKSSTVFVFLMIAFAVYFIVDSFSFQHYQAQLLALILAPAVIIMCIVQLVKETKLEDYREVFLEKTDEDVVSEDEDDYISFKQLFTLLLWIGGFVLGTYLLGFLISIPAFIFLYLALHDTKILTSLITAAVVTLFLYGVFVAFLNRSLWSGILGIY